MARLGIPGAHGCRYDFLALGSIVQRFDPGVVPLHEAVHFDRHCPAGSTTQQQILPSASECAWPWPRRTSTIPPDGG